MNRSLRINDVDFTIFDDGTVGIEVIGENDVIPISGLYDVISLSMKLASTGIREQQLDLG